MFNKSQIGRSMIEMLGVLAIIGVLSVGGLAGYTKAMRTHKINQILAYAQDAYVATIERRHATGEFVNYACSNLIGPFSMPVSDVSFLCSYGNISMAVYVEIKGDLARSIGIDFCNRVGLLDATGACSQKSIDDDAKVHAELRKKGWFRAYNGYN